MGVEKKVDGRENKTWRAEGSGEEEFEENGWTCGARGGGVGMDALKW